MGCSIQVYLLVKNSVSKIQNDMLNMDLRTNKCFGCLVLETGFNIQHNKTRDSAENCNVE
uniref:Uncharacterized protein n=1 Tax=Onchocerca volvulus TaxID=6282 RepID=A0A8R1U1M7_ONCVO